MRATEQNGQVGRLGNDRRRAQGGRGKHSWARMVQTLQQEAEGLAGYGDLVVRLTFHAGQPRQMEVIEHRRRYRFGT